MNKPDFFLRFALLFVFLLCITGISIHAQKKIYEPFFVGHPVNNAFNELVQLPDGEIRHYGFEGPYKKPARYIYIFSRDNGLTWNRKVVEDSIDFTSQTSPPAVRSPYSGDYIRLITSESGTAVLRSKDGMDGHYQRTEINKEFYILIRQPVFLHSKNRILVTGQRTVLRNERKEVQSCVLYSDDDGYNWEVAYVPVGPFFVAEWPHAKPRWQNYAIEPTIAELKDGKIWMLLRTSTDNLYESFSTDNGSSWTAPVPSRFYSTITMPTFFRMKDGRLLLFFSNTTPMPEVDRTNDNTIAAEQKTGLYREDVFTNRDATHVAISDDDGKTWVGFRELYLNPLRNEEDFATSGGLSESIDKSVHQAQAVELPDGNLLVSLGQHPLVRAMIIFDPAWIYETERKDNFSNGLTNWTTFKFINGIKGHCAYNRVPGAGLVSNPVNKNLKVLQIRHQPDPLLVCDVDGAVWNFPAALKGTFETSIYLEPGSKGGRISLMDRWFNPTDTLAWRFAVYTLKFGCDGDKESGQILKSGKWIKLSFIWDDLKKGGCRLKINGRPASSLIPINFPSTNGISYVHFQSVREEDSKGFLVEFVKASGTIN